MGPISLDTWAWGWDALVALGTLILAMGTAILAAFTARLASRTRELAQESTEDLRAQWRPLLLPAPHPDSGKAFFWLPMTDKINGDLTVRIGNAGRGPALHVRAQLVPDREPESVGPAAGGDCDWPAAVIAVGEAHELQFRHVRWITAAQILFDYRDLSGRSYSTCSVLTAVKREPRNYDVRLWEDHTATTLSDSTYPPPGLRDVSPKKRR